MGAGNLSAHFLVFLVRMVSVASQFMPSSLRYPRAECRSGTTHGHVGGSEWNCLRAGTRQGGGDIKPAVDLATVIARSFWTSLLAVHTVVLCACSLGIQPQKRQRGSVRMLQSGRLKYCERFVITTPKCRKSSCSISSNLLTLFVGPFAKTRRRRPLDS